MAQQNINIGSSANKGDGDPIRTAFTKVENNFTDVYTRLIVVESATGTNNPGGATIQQSIIGSVIADNSTLLVDGATGSIPSANLTGTLPALDGSALTNLTIPAQTFASLTSKPTTIAGYGITDALELGTSATTALAGDTALQAYVKAFGHVDVSTPINVETGSLNVASVTSGTPGIFDVTFTSALPSANYIVSLSVQTNAGSGDYTVAYYNRTTTGFQVKKFLGGTLDGGASGNFNFVVLQG